MSDECRPRQPLLVPESFSGEGNFDDWIIHFETVAIINGWDDAAKLQWMTVRMTDHGQTAFRRFPEASTGSYSVAKQAILERFEPLTMKDVYAEEFQCRKKDRAELC